MTKRRDMNNAQVIEQIKKGNYDFSYVEFESDVIFNMVGFGDGEVSFKYAIFKKKINGFINVTFGDGNVSFENSIFKNDNVEFTGTVFGKGNVSFSRARLGNGGFSLLFTIFGKGNVDFNKTHFGGGYVDFDGVDFGDGDVSFNNTDFGDGDVSFDGTEFGKGKIIFKSIKIGEGRFLIKNFNGIVFFKDIFFNSNTYISQCNLQKWNFINCDILEVKFLECDFLEDKNRLFFSLDNNNNNNGKIGYKRLENLYRQLKYSFSTIQSNEMASKAYFSEMEMKRKSLVYQRKNNEYKVIPKLAIHSIYRYFGGYTINYLTPIYWLLFNLFVLFPFVNILFNYHSFCTDWTCFWHLASSQKWYEITI